VTSVGESGELDEGERQNGGFSHGQDVSGLSGWIVEYSCPFGSKGSHTQGVPIGRSFP
jgi:hypothetical protein